MKRAYWHHCPRRLGATSDRGWLLVATGPWDLAQSLDYTHETMPIMDDTSPTGWREQSSIGSYLDYGPVRPRQDGPQVHAVFHPTRESAMLSSVGEAASWILSRLRNRDDLAPVLGRPVYS